MARWEKKKKEKGKIRKGKPERTGTNCDSRRGRGARAGATEKRRNPKSSERIGKDRWYPRKAQARCHKFPKRKQFKQVQRIVDFRRSKIKMPLFFSQLLGLSASF